MAIMIDEYQGQGGSYLVDPKSGKRTLIEQTEPAQPQSTEELTDGTANTQTPTASKG